jgi:hypothetical protein
MIARLSIAVLFVASIGLAGCGKLGDLEQPAPMFGDRAKADYEAQHRAADAARARERAAQQPAPEDNAPDPNGLPLTQAPTAPPIPGRTQAPTPTALPSPGDPAANQ